MSKYQIRRRDNEISIAGVLGADGFRTVLATIFDCVQRRGYQDLVLDFSACDLAFPVAMLPICANVVALKAKGIDSEIILPTSEQTARLFVSANWAALLDETFPKDQFRGYLQVPATRFTSLDEQKVAVDRVMDAILKSSTEAEINRDDYGAVEWALSELTDNVVNHSQSGIGGLVQFSRRRTSRRIDIVVCDAGVGIPATLMPAYPEIPSEFEALAWAIREKVTRDPEFGQGNGLFGSSEIARRSGGYFSLHSNHASLFLNEAEGLILRNERIPLVGTVVDVCMSYAEPNVLASALKFEDVVHSATDYIFLKYQADSDDHSLYFDVLKESSTVRARAAGKPICVKLANLIRMTEELIRVDFRDTPIISSSFADEAIAKLILQIGSERFRKRVRLLGITPTVKSILAKAIFQRTRQDMEI